jgi:hypothetical protein
VTFATLHAEVFTTLDGEKYTEVILKRVEPDGVVIAYADGVKKLKFQNLPPEVCAKYGYNPQSAAAYASQRYSNDMAAYEASVAISQNPQATPVSQEVQTASIRKRIEDALWNRDFVKKRVQAVEAELASGANGIGAEYLKEELAKQKEHLALAETKLARVQAELAPTPTPTHEPSFFCRLKNYLMKLFTPTPTSAPSAPTSQ